MLELAVLMIFAFPSTPYRHSNKVAAVGPTRALWDALRITDFLGACMRGPMRLVKEQERELQRQGSVKMQMVGREGLE